MFSYYPGWYAIFQSVIISLSLTFAMNKEAGGSAALDLLATLIVAGIAFALWLTMFIMQGLGLRRLAKRAGLSKPWLAFVPFAHVFLLGKLTGEVSFFGHRIRRLGLYAMLVEIVAAIYYVLMSVAIFILFVQNGASIETSNAYYFRWTDLPVAARGWETFFNLSYYNLIPIFSLVHAIVLLILYMGFYKRYAPRSYFILSFAGILVPFFSGFAIFALRKREPIDYEAILRARQAAFRAQQQSNPWQGGYGYGGSYGNPHANPYGNPYGNPYANQRQGDSSSQPPKPEDPFGEFSDGSSSKGASSASGSSGSNGGSTASGGSASSTDDGFFN